METSLGGLVPPNLGFERPQEPGILHEHETVEPSTGLIVRIPFPF